jgi:hypothetical protein
MLANPDAAAVLGEGDTVLVLSARSPAGHA